MTIYNGDCLGVLRTLPAKFVHCCVTSPPYWGLRDYGVEGQLGLESTPEEYVACTVEVFREVRRVMRDDGTLWLNLGDSYATGAGSVGDCPGGGEQGKRWKGNRGIHTAANGGLQRRSLEAMGPRTQPNRMPLPGLKSKDLIGIPWRVAFALQADGWYLRSDIIWHKPNPMPESVTDRPTRAHEYIFLFAKSERYYYDAEAIKEPAQKRVLSHWQNRKLNGEPIRRGDPSLSQHITRTASLASNEDRNKRSVWTMATEPYPEAHFATFPPALIEPCIKAGCPPGGTVFDPFGGSGTTLQVARALRCRGMMIELNPSYCQLASKRLRQAVFSFYEPSESA